MGTAPSKWLCSGKSEPNISKIIKLWVGLVPGPAGKHGRKPLTEPCLSNGCFGTIGAGNLAGDVVLSADLHSQSVVADLENLLVSALSDTWKSVAFLLGDHQAGEGGRLNGPSVTGAGPTWLVDMESVHGDMENHRSSGDSSFGKVMGGHINQVSVCHALASIAHCCS